MVELAKAYIQVIPSMKGARKTIEREFNGSQIGRKAGLDFSNGFTGAARSLGSKVASVAGTTIKTGLVAGAAVTGGLMATAINKGFGRLSAIEQATKSLEGMQLSTADIATVMENANAAVTGTAFGLDTAATAARGFIAAGLEPGKDLERVLTLVGDSAAQAGTGMDEMGLIWQKVFTKGKLQGDEALQLMERGIPIYQMVADELGITAEEAQALGEKGEISAEVFADAMENSFGGSALKMGDTVRGSFANVGAAFGRLGERILKGPFADAPAVFTAVTEELNSIAPVVEEVSARTYNAVKGIWEVLSGRGYSNALADAFGEINASKITSTLLNIREDLNTTRLTASLSLGEIRREFEWLDQAATLDNLLSVVDRGSDYVATFADGASRLATALAPGVSYLGQAAVILGGGAWRSVETLTPAVFDLATAVAEGGSALSRVFVPAAEGAVAVMVPFAEIAADALGWVADLPDPVLIAAAAFVTLKAGIGPIPALAGGLKTGFEEAGKGLAVAKDGAETLALHAMVASDNTAKIGASSVSAKGIAVGAFSAIGGAAKGLAGSLKAAFMANPIGIGLVAATTILSAFTTQAEKSKQKIRDLSDSFDEFGNVTSATREVIYDNLLADENWFGLGDNLADRIKDAGLEITDVIDAIAGDAEKLDEVTAHLEAMAVAAEAAGDPRAATELRDISDAIQKQAGDIDTASDAYSEYKAAATDAAEATADHADQIQRQIDAQRAANDLFAASASAALGAREAERAYTDAVERSQAVLDDIEASERDRESALDDVASAAHRLAQRQNENNASQSVLNETMRQGREDFIALAEDMGYTAEEAAALANELGLVEGTYTANIEADAKDAFATLGELQVDIDETTGIVKINGSAVAAETKLADLVETIDAETGEVIIDGNRFPADATVTDLMAFIGDQAGTVEIDGNDIPANDVLTAVLTAIQNGEESVTINGKDYLAQDVLSRLKIDVRGTTEQITIDGYNRPAYMKVDAAGRKVRETRENIQVGANTWSLNDWLNGIRGQTLATAYVNIQPSGRSNLLTHSVQADGSVLEFYGAGGLRENHVAQIAPAGAWRVWAEPETGGEAYIPLAQSKRSRSEQILAEVADRFGYQLMKANNYADGAITSSTTSPRGLPPVMVLEVDGYQFTAFVKEKAGELPAVRAVDEFVSTGSRHRKTRGI